MIGSLHPPLALGPPKIKFSISPHWIRATADLLKEGEIGMIYDEGRTISITTTKEAEHVIDSVFAKLGLRKSEGRTQN